MSEPTDETLQAIAGHLSNIHTDLAGISIRFSAHYGQTSDVGYILAVIRDAIGTTQNQSILGHFATLLSRIENKTVSGTSLTLTDMLAALAAGRLADEEQEP